MNIIEEIDKAKQLASQLHDILCTICENSEMNNMVFAKDSCCEIIEYLDAEKEGVNLDDEEYD